MLLLSQKCLVLVFYPVTLTVELSIDSPMNMSDISDSELNDDDERIEVGSESTSFSAKRGRSSISESISTSSDKNESKRKCSRI